MNWKCHFGVIKIVNNDVPAAPRQFEEGVELPFTPSVTDPLVGRVRSDYDAQWKLVQVRQLRGDQRV